MPSDQLSKLGATSMASSSANNDVSTILREFEDAIGARLPKPYADILVTYGTTITFDKDVQFRPRQKSPWDRKNGTQSLEVLYGLSGDRQSLPKQNGIYAGRMPHGMIPIGEAPGGNIILLGVKGDASGKVYLWDHEDEREITGVPENDFGNLYLIANTIEEFLNSLEVEPDDSVEKGDGITKMWLDPDL